MTIFRIGDKVVSLDKLNTGIQRILDLRSQGHSQQEVAKQVGVDRTFISRLESLGEVRKGNKIALIGFPISNKEEIIKVAEEMAVDYVYVLNYQERVAFFEDKKGSELLNEIMTLIAKIREFDVVVLIGSDFRIRLAETLVDDTELIPITIGQSPIEEGKYVSPQVLKEILKNARKRAEK